MRSIEEICAYFAGDLFAMKQGILIDEAEHGRAVCSVVLREEHCNALGSAQGGLIFTLADFAFAVAANCGEQVAVTLNSNIEFLRPPKGEKLTATAVCYSKSSRICRYEIAVEDELGTQVARVGTTGYIR